MTRLAKEKETPYEQRQRLEATNRALKDEFVLMRQQQITALRKQMLEKKGETIAPAVGGHDKSKACVVS